MSRVDGVVNSAHLTIVLSSLITNGDILLSTGLLSRVVTFYRSREQKWSDMRIAPEWSVDQGVSLGFAKQINGDGQNAPFE